MAKIIRINARPAYEARIEAENRAYTRHAMQILDSFASQLIPANMHEVHVRLPQRVPVRTIVAPRNLTKRHARPSNFMQNCMIDAKLEAMLRANPRFSGIARYLSY